ncbi:hypothetical protein LTR85_002829 [Meristemomyces frigidus]|nr:hypothetical protein LTR85_002829 [Meristemomyces frigidus]
MSRHAEDEELELSEAYSSERSSTAGQEQEQRLLGRWAEQDGEKLVGGDGSVGKCRRRGWATWVAIAAAIAVALVVTIYAVLGSPQKTRDEDGDFFSGIQTNDYILDPQWDTYASPQRREYTWTVRDEVHNPDGIYRPMMLVNHQYPGPLVEVNEGDTIVVHVDNQAVNATSIHWHGLYQNGTPHMDGTVGITQCAIAPGGKFTYEFTVSGQSGTYWWHAHQGVQSSDGMHGPLIVHGRDERKLQQIEYATDRVVLVSDHYHDLSSALLWQYLAPDMENAEPVPEGGLINGRSIRSCDEYPDRQCDNTTSNVGLAAFDLAPNQSHRLRIINVGAFAEFQFQIDEHELAVTEVDGTDVMPVNYHRLNINPAQRYSVVINTAVANADAFWLRARMITKCFTDPPKTLDPEVRAIVRYSTSSVSTEELPNSIDWEEKLELECSDMNTTELAPVQAIAAPAEADAFFYFRSNFEIGAYRLSRGFFDSSSWRPDARSPSLLRSVDGLSEANASFTSAAVSDAGSASAFINDAAFEKSRELVLQTTGSQTIDILVSNFDDGNHPLHLHGYKYFVLAQGHGYPPMKSAVDGMTRDNIQPLYDSLDLTNPLRRDTASVEAFGWILLRLVADNPGAWAFHCHISWHTEAGLLMQFLTRTDELAKLVVPDANRALCAAAGLEKGMGPDDEVYHGLAK